MVEGIAPQMFVVAGPAGSGKTTSFPLRLFGVDFFSVDDRCAELNHGSYVGILPALRALVAADCRAFIEQHILDRRSFAVETTLRIERITARGRMGGHSSPETEIRAIFAASMGNLPRAIAVFERVECFDNSHDGMPPNIVITFDRGRVIHRTSSLPAWVAGLESIRGGV